MQLLYRSNRSATNGLKSGRGIRYAASDSRDYVYGFLGLASEGSTFGIEPLYTKSAAQLYTEASTAMLKSGDVDILRCAGGHHTNHDTRDLPS